MMTEKFKMEKNKDIDEKFEKASDALMKLFTRKAIKDTEKILDVNDKNFKEVAYSIFRAYNMGFSMGVLKNTAEKIENSNNF